MRVGSTQKVMEHANDRLTLRAFDEIQKRMAKLNMGEVSEDIHECIRCLKAIMYHPVCLSFFNKYYIHATIP